MFLKGFEFTKRLILTLLQYLLSIYCRNVKELPFFETPAKVWNKFCHPLIKHVFVLTLAITYCLSLN